MKYPYKRTQPLESYHTSTFHRQWTKRDHMDLLSIIGEPHDPPLTAYQIAERLGRSKSGVISYCHRQCIPLPNRRLKVNGCKARADATDG